MDQDFMDRYFGIRFMISGLVVIGAKVERADLARSILYLNVPKDSPWYNGIQPDLYFDFLQQKMVEMGVIHPGVIFKITIRNQIWTEEHMAYIHEHMDDYVTEMIRNLLYGE